MSGLICNPRTPMVRWESETRKSLRELQGSSLGNTVQQKGDPQFNRRKARSDPGLLILTFSLQHVHTCTHNTRTHTSEEFYLSCFDSYSHPFFVSVHDLPTLLCLSFSTCEVGNAPNSDVANGVMLSSRPFTDDYSSPLRQH